MLTLRVISNISVLLSPSSNYPFLQYNSPQVYYFLHFYFFKGDTKKKKKKKQHKAFNYNPTFRYGQL